MRQVQKKEGKMIYAYCLGEEHEMIDKLIRIGTIKQIDNLHWRVISQEAKEGEVAVFGDYIKLDSSGTPYPNTREYFLKNHKHLGGDAYVQIPQKLYAWCAEDDMCSEIQFLIDHKGLRLNDNNEKAYYSAPLWGDILSAAKDAMIVFYDLQYDSNHSVVDADFNFVARDEFNRTYKEL